MKVKIPHDVESMTIRQFCQRHQIGRTTYFQMRKSGFGPREIRVGHLVRISFDSERDWLQQVQLADKDLHVVTGAR